VSFEGGWSANGKLFNGKLLKNRLQGSWPISNEKSASVYLKRIGAAISTGVNVLIHPLRLRRYEGSTKPAFNSFVKDCRDTIAEFAESDRICIWRSSFGWIMNDKGRYRQLVFGT
jgi:hypothetical protein